MKKQILKMQSVVDIEGDELRSVSGGLFETIGIQIVTWAIVKYYETKNAIDTIQNARQV